MSAINDFENKQPGDDYSTLIWKFQELGDYKDSVEMAEKCKELQKEYENKQQEQQSDAKPETESKGEDEWTVVFRKANLYSADYYKAVIDDVRVNEDFGTSASGDYIASVYVTWNEKNSGKTSKEMLDLYSSDMAARMYDDLPEIQELVVYWTVPYLNNGSAKISFERTSSGMKYTDKIFDSNFD